MSRVTTRSLIGSRTPASECANCPRAAMTPRQEPPREGPITCRPSICVSPSTSPFSITEQLLAFTKWHETDKEGLQGLCAYRRFQRQQQTQDVHALAINERWSRWLRKATSKARQQLANVLWACHAVHQRANCFSATNRRWKTIHWLIHNLLTTDKSKKVLNCNDFQVTKFPTFSLSLNPSPQKGSDSGTALSKAPTRPQHRHSGAVCRCFKLQLLQK